MDISTLIDLMMKDGDFVNIMRNPWAQFSLDMMRKTYLGARFLPERLMIGTENNIVRETETRFRTVIAEDSGRYDPVPLRHAAEGFDMLVELGHMDIGREIVGPEYDKLIKLLGRVSSEAARQRILSFVDEMINHAIKDKRELQRWQAIVLRSVTVSKSNGQEYNVNIQSPPENTIIAPAFFNDNSVDPYDIIFDAVDVLKTYGYGEVEAIVTTKDPLKAMRRNEQVKGRYGGMRLDIPNNSITPVNRGVVTNAVLNQVLSEEGLPPFTEYNQGYNTEEAFYPYLPNHTVTIIARTTRREEIIVTDGEDLLESMEVPGTVGYTAVGRCEGETEVGDIVKVFSKAKKPVGITAQGESVSFPIPTESKAIVNIFNCVPT